MTYRVVVEEKHFKCYQDEGDRFLNCVVARDETWLRNSEPELKSKSSEWHGPGSRRPAKF